MLKRAACASVSAVAISIALSREVATWERTFSVGLRARF